MKPPILVHPGSGLVRDLVLGYHMHPDNARRLVAAAPDAIHLAIGAGPYSVKTGAIAPLEHVKAWAAEKTGATIRRAIGVAWSAGCGGWRAQLEAGQHPDALVLADGMHSSLPVAPSHLDTWRAYFRAACDGERVLIASSSHMSYVERLKPPQGTPYASVHRVLRGVTGWELDDWGSRDAPAVTAKGSAEVWLVDSGDADADAHMWHVKACLPRMFARALELLDGTKATAATEPTLISPALPIGVRALVWSREQMRLEVKPSPGTKARWFLPCERSGRRIWAKLEPAAAAKLNHCAAAASAALAAVALDGDVAPHGYRAAAKELMADAVARGTWRPAAYVRDGRWMPAPGDLAIYDRSQPGKPETAWQGHVDRVSEVEPNRYRNLGANEGAGGAWVEQWTPYDHPRLLGFVEYPRERRAASDSEPPISATGITPEDERHVRALVALTVDQAEAEFWEGWRETREP